MGNIENTRLFGGGASRYSGSKTDATPRRSTEKQPRTTAAALQRPNRKAKDRRRENMDALDRRDNCGAIAARTTRYRTVDRIASTPILSAGLAYSASQSIFPRQRSLTSRS